MLDEESSHLASAAIVQQVSSALAYAMRNRNLDPLSVFRKLDSEATGYLSQQQLQAAFESMKLGFSPRNYFDVVQLCDQEKQGLEQEKLHEADLFYRKISIESVCQTLDIPRSIDGEEGDKMMVDEDKYQPAIWQCMACSFVNSAKDRTCAICELGWTGKRECPPDKWECLAEHGGCTFFNSKKSFYCEVCNRARPDLSSARF